MVSQTTIQAKVNKGSAIATAKAGVACAWYRATSATNPLAGGNQLGTLQVLFDTSATMGQRTPRRRDKPEDWFGAFDITGIALGDYLVTPAAETFFVATLDPFRPARLVLCNRTVEISEPEPMQGVGEIAGYGGDLAKAETVLASGWPCSIAQGNRVEPSSAGLPGDVRLPWTSVLLPAIPGVTLRNGLILTDDEEFRRIISSTELTPLGWRCTAVLETA